MTYKNRFAAVIKVKGRHVAEESGGVFRVPFGSSYSIFMKNMDTRKALVYATIDGEDVLNGNALVIDANSTQELGGYMRGQIEKFDFKFMRKTADVSEHRGDRIDDGIIRIEFAFEEGVHLRFDAPVHMHSESMHLKHWHYDVVDRIDETLPEHTIQGMMTESSSSESCSNRSVKSFGNFVTTNHAGDSSLDFSASYAPDTQEQGYSVPGASRNVPYRYASIGSVGPSEVLILRLVGATKSGAHIQQPTVTRTHKTCSTCHKSNTYQATYCMRCGANLEA